MSDHVSAATGERPEGGSAVILGPVTGRVDNLSPDGVLTGFGRDMRWPKAPARIDLLCGPHLLGTAFGLVTRSTNEVDAAGPDSGFRLRACDLDAALVRAAAQRDPAQPLRVRISHEDLPWAGEVATIGELGACLDLASAQYARDLADEYRIVALSGLFDEGYYVERYPDIAASGIDPLFHYLVAGEREGRSGSYYFDPPFYAGLLGRKPETASVLCDYALNGGGSSVATSIHFDAHWYVGRYGSAGSVVPLADYMRQRRTRSPNPFFDVVDYLERYPDVRDLPDPYMHFAEWGGVREGRLASSSFDARYYKQRYLAGDASQNAFLHFLSIGRFQGFAPAPGGAEPTPATQVRENSQPGAFFEADALTATSGATDVKTFAFYLPQFHPIPENDAFWGTGFTEWRNLSRGQPRFAGHYQPRTPRDLGFYDLLQPEAIRRQVQLAATAGIFGFCFYFYWFNGRRVLEKPLDLFVEDETLSMPFCLMWANENWTRRWDGQEKDVLLRQDYDRATDKELFACFAEYFSSPRYYRIDGRPLLILYRPGIIPDAAGYVARLKSEVAASIGVEPLVFMTQAFGDEDPRLFGLDGAIEFPPHKVTSRAQDIANRQHVLDWSFSGQVFDYDEIAALSLADLPRDYPLAKTVLPMWDNDARKQGSGLCIHGSTPAKFQAWFSATCDIARQHRIGGDALVFVNAWNEWCEGTYLEPDLHHGWAYLNSVARALSAERPAVSDGRYRVLLVGHDAFPAGAQYLLLHIGRQLADFGCEVTYYLLDGGDMIDAYQKVGPVVLRSEEPAEPFLRRIRAAGYDHALTNTAASGGVVPALKAGGFRVVSLVHELPALIRSYGLEDSCRAIAREADRVVFASSFVADQFYALTGGDPDRGLLREQGLYGASDEGPDGDPASLKTELGLSPDTRVVLGVGYGDLRKGVDVFASFARQMATTDPDLHFVWIGALDPMVATWIGADRARTGAANLHFVGHRTDVARFYVGADLLFLPSREDPYPTVVLEALDAGLGVVAFDGCGGFTELLSNPLLGRLVPFGDARTFAFTARALAELGRNPVLRRQRRDFVRAHFNWSDYCFDLAQILFPDLKSVSVVVPNYNYARYLDDRLRSIFGQTYPVREIVVLDDASSDASIQAVSDVSEACGRSVELAVKRRNSGNVFRQWKRGLDGARGEYLWIAEADDLAGPAFLATLVTKLARLDKPGFAFSDSRAIDGAGAPLYDSYKGYYAAEGDAGLSHDGAFGADAFLSRFLTVRNLVLNVSAVLWHADHLRGVFERLGPEAFTYTCAGDWRIYVESCRAGGEVAYAAEPLNLHRRHDGSVTHLLDKPQHFDEVRRVQEVALASLAEPDALRARVRACQDELRAGWHLSQAHHAG